MQFEKKLKQAREFCQNNKLSEAKEIYLTVLQKYHLHEEALQNLGVIYIHQKELLKAELIFETLYKIKKDQNFLQNYVNLKIQLSKYKEALEINEHIKENRSYYLNKIRALRLLEDYQKAEEEVDKAIEHHSNVQGFYIQRSIILNSQKKYKESLIILQNLLDQFTSKFEQELTKINIAIVFREQGEFEKSNKILEELKSSEIYKDQIQLEVIKNCIYAQKIDELEGNISKIKNKEEKANIYALAAEFYKERNDLNKALQHYQYAIKYNQKKYEYYAQIAEIFLKRGELIKGLEYWKFRVRNGLQMNKRFFTDDTEIKSLDRYKKIRVLAEQGIGDEFFFFRLLALVEDQERHRFEIYADRRLVNLLKINLEKYEIYPIDMLKEKQDKKIIDINVGSILNTAIKNLDASLINKFYITKNEVQQKVNKRIRIGISWKSENRLIGKNKSIPLEEYLGALEDYKLNVELVLIQYKPDRMEIEMIKNKGFILNHSDKWDLYNDIDLVAKLIQDCDLIVTVCNINAHISGAFEKNTLLLKTRDQEQLWYWTDNNQNWYKNIKHIKQDSNGGWKLALTELKNELGKFIN